MSCITVYEGCANCQHFKDEECTNREAYEDEEMEDYETCPYKEERVDSEEKVNGSFTKLLELFGKPIEQSLLQTALATAAKSLADSLRSEMREVLRELIKLEFGKEVKRIAKEYMETEIAAVMCSKIVLSGSNSWDQKEVQIRDIVRTELSECIKSLKNDYTRDDKIKEVLNKFISKEMHERVTKAVEETKREIANEMTATTMKEIVKTVANVVGSDKKLLAMLAI